MKRYHSSIQPVETPDTVHSRSFLDFGKGFYLTSICDQAEKYAQRFVRRQQQAWLNVYEFDSYNREWLDFIAKCRAGKDDTDFDIVIGGIANDKVIRTLDRFFAGELSVQQTLGLLQYEKPNIQYCIRSQKMIDRCLEHVESIRL